jgi:hypothetical protein
VTFTAAVSNGPPVTTGLVTFCCQCNRCFTDQNEAL